MTEHYWQRYQQSISNEFMNRVENKLWQNVKKDLARKQQPKHHLELYSMCKSENPYIIFRQIKNSPNITTQTVAQLICRDKACQLQYCLSIQKLAGQNRRKIIDLKGCKEQYHTMWNCITNERVRVLKREEQLKNLVLHGIKQESKVSLNPLLEKKQQNAEITQTQYI